MQLVSNIQTNLAAFKTFLCGVGSTLSKHMERLAAQRMKMSLRSKENAGEKLLFERAPFNKSNLDQRNLLKTDETWSNYGTNVSSPELSPSDLTIAKADLSQRLQFQTSIFYA